MPKRKKKRIFTNGNGVEHIIEGPEIILSKGSLEDLLIDALGAEADDVVIKEKAKELRSIIQASEEKLDTLHRWYKVGEILRFVDDLMLRDEASKREAFQRLFDDLQVDSKRNPTISKIARYPDHMYRLAKLPPQMVFYRGMNWSKWFDILEYRKICDNKEILENIIKCCCDEKWDSKTLRKELQGLNKSLK